MTSSDSPQVSVTIPVYNGSVYIAKTVASILEQTFTDFELLLVNDGSTDDSLDLINELKATDERIKVFTKTNGGIASARNFGVSQARGTLIAFCDQDDLWEPGKLEAQVPRFDDPKVALCYTDAFSLTLATGEQQYRIREKHEGRVFDDLLYWNFISSCSVMLRKSALDAIGGFYDDRRLMGVDDWHCWLELALRHEVAYVPEPLCTHVNHGSNYSSKTMEMTAAEMICIEKIAESAEKLNVKRPWASIKCDVLTSRARLCVTKGDFRNGAQLFRQAHETHASVALMAKSLLFSYTPIPILGGLQSLKRQLL